MNGTGQADTPTATGRSRTQWLTSFVVVALVAAMAVQVLRTGDQLASIERLSLSVLATTCFLQLMSQLFLNASMLLPLRTSVPRLGFWELFIVRTGGFLVGSLVPVAGGIAVRLAYLRQRGVSYADFTWATLLSNVLALAAAAVVAVLATAVFWASVRRPPVAVVAVACGVVLLSGVALLVFDSIAALTRWSKLRRWAWLSNMPGLRADPSMACGVFLHSIARHVLSFATYGLLTQALAGDFLTGGLVYAVTSPVRMVNITPGNIGVTEWVVALVGQGLAFDLSIGLIAALAFRAVALIAQGAGMALGSAWIALGRGK
jgi:uncharacterized membrane protein YbhN (UPF0104 family)